MITNPATVRRCNPLHAAGASTLCLLLIGALAMLTTTGCERKEVTDRTMMVEADDKEMNAAIDKARATVDTFIKALKSPKPRQSSMTVKMAFTDGGETEYMWLADVTYDGKAFHGKIDNYPDTVKNVKIGQKVTVDATQIFDWMYIDNKKLVGGYTLRILLARWPAAERAEFEKNAPYTIVD